MASIGQLQTTVEEVLEQLKQLTGKFDLLNTEVNAIKEKINTNTPAPTAGRANRRAPNKTDAKTTDAASSSTATDGKTNDAASSSTSTESTTDTKTDTKGKAKKAAPKDTKTLATIRTYFTDEFSKKMSDPFLLELEITAESIAESRAELDKKQVTFKKLSEVAQNKKILVHIYDNYNKNKDHTDKITKIKELWENYKNEASKPLVEEENSQEDKQN